MAFTEAVINLREGGDSSIYRLMVLQRIDAFRYLVQ
jgi:hypothetical protein